MIVELRPIKSDCDVRRLLKKDYTYVAKNPEPPLPKERLNPLVMALAWLGPRFKEYDGQFWIDGVPKNLWQVMQEVNRLRVKCGEVQILYCERWRWE